MRLPPAAVIYIVFKEQEWMACLSNISGQYETSPEASMCEPFSKLARACHPFATQTYKNILIFINNKRLFVLFN